MTARGWQIIAAQQHEKTHGGRSSYKARTIGMLNIQRRRIRTPLSDPDLPFRRSCPPVVSLYSTQLVSFTERGGSLLFCLWLGRAADVEGGALRRLSVSTSQKSLAASLQTRPGGKGGTDPDGMPPLFVGEDVGASSLLRGAQGSKPHALRPRVRRLTRSFFQRVVVPSKYPCILTAATGSY